MIAGFGLTTLGDVMKTELSRMTLAAFLVPHCASSASAAAGDFPQLVEELQTRAEAPCGGEITRRIG